MEIPDIRTWCAPALCNLILGVITIIGSLFHPIVMSILILNVVVTLLWSMLLQFLCKRGYTMVSWFLVLFPYVALFLGIYYGWQEIQSDPNFKNDPYFQQVFGVLPKQHYSMQTTAPH